MKILWLSWKDIRHPAAGGAEVVANELAKRLVNDGHKVKFINSLWPGALNKETIDGYTVIRVGGRYSVYWQARKYYKRHLRDWPDVVIEEINTVPFFSRFYVKQRRVLFFHMLAREIWFYQMPFPFNWIGYWLEPLYLRVLHKDPAVTVSASTKQDLTRYGFMPDNISIISEGIQLEPIKNLQRIRKYRRPTLLSLGAIRPMKRTDQQIQAFEIAKRFIPNLQLKVAGDAADSYGKRVLHMISANPFRKDIEYLGKVSQAKKRELLQKAHLITVTSVKEGWGLIVTEAASQGTPAIVYDVDGLRDSVRENETGLIAHQNNPYDLASKIITLFHHRHAYRQFQRNAWQWTKDINFNNSFKQFQEVLGV